MRNEVRQTFYLLGLLVLIIALWPTQILAPLKILVVFFHETSHALTVVATGGTVKEMVINASQGGHVISSGDNRFLTLSAGYLGSLLWGAIIFLITVRTNKDRVTSMVLGLAVLIIAAVFVRNFYGLFFSILTGGSTPGLSPLGESRNQ